MVEYPAEMVEVMVRPAAIPRRPRGGGGAPPAQRRGGSRDSPLAASSAT